MTARQWEIVLDLGYVEEDDEHAAWLEADRILHRNGSVDFTIVEATGESAAPTLLARAEKAERERDEARAAMVPPHVLAGWCPPEVAAQMRAALGDIASLTVTDLSLEAGDEWWLIECVHRIAEDARAVVAATLAAAGGGK